MSVSRNEHDPATAKRGGRVVRPGVIKRRTYEGGRKSCRDSTSDGLTAVSTKADQAEAGQASAEQGHAGRFGNGRRIE